MTTIHKPPNSGLGIHIVSKDSWIPEELNWRIKQYDPKSEFGRYIRDCLKFLPREMAIELIERASRITIVESRLDLTKIWGGKLKGLAEDFGKYAGFLEDFGCVGVKVITDDGVARIVDTFDNTVTDADQRYHGIGTGTIAENQTDTALGTELTTEYNPNSTRATGTFSQPSANISRSVATNTLDSGTPAVTEHGVFSQAATGGGTLLDRTVFSAINLVGANGDGIQSTYSMTITAGS